ncbi:MAG: Ig-like domain-containing protein, partial [Ignavibacteriaceae bacterium]
MAEITKKTLKYLTLLIAGLLLANCANQLPPGGGDIDRTPPEIIEVYPAEGTTNFNDDYFEIGFSEYVDKRSVQDAIFISPAVDGQLELDWSGKYVRVIFPGQLRENTTYVITIGTDLVDYNNKNRMANAYTLTFSTGNEIDRRVVTGRVYEPKPEGVLIFAYQLIPPGEPGYEDTLLNYKPDYISQTGTNGSYSLGGLAAGSYRIFAVKDEFRDLLFQPGQDKIGVPFTDITLSETDTLYTNLNFYLINADTSAPRLLTAVMTDQFHFLLNLSEEFDSTFIRADNFFIYDSTAGTKNNVLYAYKGNTKPTELVLVTDAAFPVENSIYLFADSLADKSGNVYLSDFAAVTVSDRADTIAPTIFKSSPLADYDKVDYQGQSFYFVLNDAVDSAEAKQGISFTDTSGNKINYSINFIDDGSFLIVPARNLEPKKDYIISFDYSRFVDAAGNKLDSVYQYKFSTITGLDFT